MPAAADRGHAGGRPSRLVSALSRSPRVLAIAPLVIGDHDGDTGSTVGSGGSRFHSHGEEHRYDRSDESRCTHPLRRARCVRAARSIRSARGAAPGAGARPRDRHQPARLSDSSRRLRGSRSAPGDHRTRHLRGDSGSGVTRDRVPRRRRGVLHTPYLRWPRLLRRATRRRRRTRRPQTREPHPSRGGELDPRRRHRVGVTGDASSAHRRGDDPHPRWRGWCRHNRDPGRESHRGVRGHHRESRRPRVRPLPRSRCSNRLHIDGLCPHCGRVDPRHRGRRRLRHDRWRHPHAKSVGARRLRPCRQHRRHRAATESHRSLGQERRLSLCLYTAEPGKARRTHHPGRTRSREADHRRDSSARSDGRSSRAP
nr:hypothetical protein CPGR_02992 [Mycolicibacterium malmesburyense]